MKKYFKPKSLAFWSAMVEAGIQVARLFGAPIPVAVDGIIAGLFGIGMRAAIAEPVKRKTRTTKKTKQPAPAA